MSIGKAQADLLADSFLDDIGSDPEVFAPKETLSTFFQLAGELILLSQEYLNECNAIASGRLSESIQAEEPITGRDFIQQDISMLYYGKFIDQGVRGTKGGHGAYAFKNDYPNKKMIKSFEGYLKDARSKIGTEPKAPGKNESKNIAVAQRQSAAAMARAVKQHGIKPCKFMEKALNDIDKVIDERFSEAITIDVINSIPDEL